MPGLASADPHTLSTLSISRTNGQARSNGLLSPPRNRDEGHASEQSRVDNRTSIHRKEVLPRFDMRAAEESLSLYCKPIELYNIIQRRALRNPVFLQRCLRYKIDEARQRRIKLTISSLKVTVTKCDARLSNRLILEEQAFQSVLLMLTTPVTSAKAGNSCFRLSQTRVLRTMSLSLSAAHSKEQSSVTFLLPELKKLLLTVKRDGAVIVFITSAEINSSCSGNDTPIESSVNSSGSVFWGSVSLTTLCQSWSNVNGDGKDFHGAMHKIPDDTLEVELFPSRLQLVNSMDGRYVNFQPTAPITAAHSMARLQISLSVQEFGRGANVTKTVNGNSSSNGRFVNCPPLSQARRLQPGQVIFHYHYYSNQLYKSEVTENFSCPFCVRCCSSLKGLRCHLNSTHDLFTFEFLATSDYRLVNVFCRNDVLDPEGNVRDIEGLNDPRLKNFVYWSKCGRPRKSTIVLDLHAGKPQSDGRTSDFSMGQGAFSVSQPKLLPCSDKTENPGLIQEQHRKHERSDEQGRIAKVTEEAAQALKKPRADVEELKTLSSVGNRFAGMAPNGVCLAIAAPRPADKRSVQSMVNTQVLPVKARVDKHRKSLVERSEARVRFQLQKRQFYHSHTTQPMALEQLLSDRDSEDENDEAIMDLEDCRMLDDFVDVTQDEKKLMHLWNSFVRKQSVLADGHCPWACEAFTKLHAKCFHSSMALRRCLMLFLVKLWNHNLVDGNTINKCLLIIDSFKDGDESGVSTSNPKV
ncbi:hypothetical protein GOP47_0014416 [Adiantum capillus-veneris]|uniref:C2H2-type domain-containing protein n=1 Tax=Adiantum capillus-veneris TaxID=13818 RepID=A0A9D4ZC46_ADICA|nr:hypothetical protein GOP47_0014416 [Adiantum capillus-veneris]